MTKLASLVLLFVLQIASTAAQEPEGSCNTDVQCGTYCYNANVAECTDASTSSCQLMDPLPENYQTVVDSGVSTAESLLEDNCYPAPNSCNGVLFSEDESLCKDGEIVSKEEYHDCGLSGQIICSVDEACKGDNGDNPSCVPIADLCGADKEEICSNESRGDFYIVLMTKDQSGNLQFKGESATWGIAEYSRDYICNVDCDGDSSSTTSAPTSSSGAWRQTFSLVAVLSAVATFL